MNDAPAAEPPASVGAADAAAIATRAASAALGRTVHLAGAPEELPVGFGADAYACRLVGAGAAPWANALVVHVCASRADAEREAGWYAWAGGQGFPAARFLAAWCEGPYGVVVARPELQSSVGRMIADPAVMPELVGSLGRLHARLHAQPVADAPGPVVDWPTALARLDAAVARAARAVAGGRPPAGDASPQRVAASLGLGEQRAWLVAHDPGPITPVPCHGDFTPVNVHVDPRDHRSAVVAGWSGAVLGDREFDVALSELAFWTAAYLSPDERGRALLERARAHMLDGYAAGYRATGGVSDARRLDHWGAYHACTWSAMAATVTLASAARAEGWTAAGLAAVRATYRADLADRFDRLAASAAGTSGNGAVGARADPAPRPP